MSLELVVFGAIAAFMLYTAYFVVTAHNLFRSAIGLTAVLIGVAGCYLLMDAAFLSAILAGLVAFPIVMPWIPTRDFSSKGLVLGGLVALPFAVSSLLGSPGSPWWQQAAGAVSLVLIAASITAFLALKFTGSTTFTSRSGVRREMFAYIPVMAWMFGLGLTARAVLFLA